MKTFIKFDYFYGYLRATYDPGYVGSTWGFICGRKFDCEKYDDDTEQLFCESLNIKQRTGDTIRVFSNVVIDVY